ncbi:MAG TPA: hypothetical protein PKK00_09725 [Bacteroidales bacterium]|nr:hypothetical protein [Bacteroidales bacterium]HPS17502.1 hypothetical protein [Bacteroidales bacterium]
MKHKQLIVSLVLACFLSSCVVYVLRSHKPKYITKKIKLNNKNQDDYFVTYENRSAIIYLYKHDVVKLLEHKLKNKKLCEQRQLKYNELLKKIIALDKNAFVIIPSDKLPEMHDFKIKFDTTKTAYAPLDYYAKSIAADINYNWIAPYGYVPQYTDTLNAVKFGDFYYWIAAQLILDGKAKVFRKEKKEFQDYVLFETVDFRDGHGGKSLLYDDKNIFLNVAVFTDMRGPDFECMDSTQIKKYWGTWK